MAAPLRHAVLSVALKNRQICKFHHRCLSLYANSLQFDKFTPNLRPKAGLLHQRPASHPTSHRLLHLSSRLSSTKPTKTLENETSEENETIEDEYHSIIKDTERSKGPTDQHEFQAETKKLLDIVAKSLYSEKEVFIRELISNASDALERLRYQQLSGGDVEGSDHPLEIHISVNEEKKTFTIQDTGIGLTKEELIENIGTIAKSGSKTFLSQVAEKSGGNVNRNIIGQFGVGFYSSFMVGDKVEVFTKSRLKGNGEYKWVSDGLGTYELAEAEGVQPGTKITIHLKGDCYDFAKEETIKGVIEKYSNFVGVPIYLNGKKVNVVQALWTQETRNITPEMHEEFFRFIADSYDRPRYSLHYKTDAPLDIKALFYVPEHRPSMYDLSRESDVSVTLYSRKIMIMSKANHILPRWLRFVKGVVDSEDIPLNLSRELLQDSALIRKLRWVLTNRLLKFFQENSKKDKEKYLQFFQDFGLFFKEGIVITQEQEQREEIGRLLRFESSALAPGEKTSLDEYASRMKAGERKIYYYSAPSRHLAESSPYMEAMKEKDTEVLFMYEPHDELVMMNLGQFDRKTLMSIENEMVADKADVSTVDSTDESSLTQEQADDLMSWLQVTLGSRVHKAKITKRLSTHPCVITLQEMGAARHFLRTAAAEMNPQDRHRLVQPTLEVNPTHPIIRKLYEIKGSNSELAKLVTEQIFDNAMAAAGLMEDPRTMLNRMNDLLTLALEKH